MKTYILLTMLLVLAVSRSHAQQDTIYSARVNDVFLIAMEQTTLSLLQQYPINPEIREAIGSLKIKYLIEKDRIVRKRSKPGTATPLAELQKEVAQELMDLLSPEQQAFFVQENKRWIRLHSMVWAAGAELRIRNTDNLAYRETATMRERYNLSNEQFNRVHAVNQHYYAQLTSLVEQEKSGTRSGTRSAGMQKLQEARQQQLSVLLGTAKYRMYKQDMEAIEMQAKRDRELEKAAWEQYKYNQKP